jgi:hypothetical protein
MSVTSLYAQYHVMWTGLLKAACLSFSCKLIQNKCVALQNLLWTLFRSCWCLRATRLSDTTIPWALCPRYNNIWLFYCTTYWWCIAQFWLVCGYSLFLTTANLQLSEANQSIKYPDALAYYHEVESYIIVTILIIYRRFLPRCLKTVERP